MEWQMEETVKGDTTCIDGGNTRGSQYDGLLLGIACHMAQKSRFTRPRLSGEKERVTGIFDYLDGLLPFLVVGVEFHLEIDVVVCGLFLLLVFCCLLLLWFGSFGGSLFSGRAILVVEILILGVVYDVAFVVIHHLHLLGSQ